MRKIPIFLIIFSVLAAAAGFFIRGAELETAFDPISGLAIPGAGMTTLLIALTAAVAAAAIAASAMISARFAPPNAQGGEAVAEEPEAAEAEAKEADSEEPEAAEPVAIEPDSEEPEAEPSGGGERLAAKPVPIGLLELLVSLLGCVIWFAGSAGGFISKSSSVGAGAYTELAFFILSAASAISAALVAHGAYIGRTGGFCRFLSIIPPIFFSYWMILLYRIHASDPVIVNYGYECLAIAAAAMSFYFLAGYLYGKSEPGKTLFCMVMTVFLCGAVSADAAFTLSEKMIILSAPIISLANILPLTRWLVRREKRPEQA